jgi:AraC family transcriptional regulator
VFDTRPDFAASVLPHGINRLAVERDAAQTISLISRSARSTPLRTVHADSDAGPSLAMWRFTTGGRIALDPLPCNVLSYLRHGTPTVTRIAGGRYATKRLRAGAVTFLPQGRASEWLLEGAAASLHVYIPPRAVQAFVEEHPNSPCPLEIDDFFGIEDSWLGTYFQMLVSEYDTFSSQQAPTDSLLVDQTQHSLLRHLIRWHSSISRSSRDALDRRNKVSPLRPAVLQRISEFIDANLAADISLHALADLAALSVEHFLRSFHAATGKTPYQYVLEQRLDKAALLLKTNAAPVSAIAPECGFQNPSHFSVRFRAHFGVSPSEFRRGLGKGTRNAEPDASGALALLP